MIKKLCAMTMMATLLILVISAVGVSKKVEISYWRFGGVVEELELEPTLMKMFNEKYPDIKATYDQWSWTTRREKMLTAFLTDSMPDIFLMYEDHMPEFAKMRMIMPIGELTQDAPSVIAEWAERFVPAFFGAWKFQGKLYALGQQAEVSPMILYNTKMFKDAGLPGPPETWDDMIEYGKKLTKGDVSGIALQADRSSNASEIYASWVYINGGRFFAEDGKTLTINDAAWVDVLEFFSDLVNKHKITSPGALELYHVLAANLFFSGRAAMATGESWAKAIAKEAGAKPGFPYDLALAPVRATPSGTRPRPKEKFIYLASNAYMVSASTTHKEEVLKFLDFMAQEDVQKFWRGDPVPGRVSATRESIVTSMFRKQFGFIADAYDETELETMTYFERFPGYGAVSDIISVARQAAIGEEMSAQEALDIAQKDAEPLVGGLVK